MYELRLISFSLVSVDVAAACEPSVYNSFESIQAVP